MDRDRLLRRAIALSALSIAISGTFGIVAVAVALASDQLSLLGFGFNAAMDSVASVVLLWRFRLETSRPAHADRAERLAEVGVNLVLVLLGVYLGIRSIVALVSAGQPDTTVVGTLISLASLVVLPVLAVAKLRTARALSSRSLRADGTLTAIAAMLALIALVGALLTESLGIPWADAIGGLVASVVLLREGTGGIRGLGERSGTSISMG